MKVLAVCVVLACVAVSSATKFTNQNSLRASSISIDIVGCEDESKEYCEFPADQYLEFSITFTADADAEHVKALSWWFEPEGQEKLYDEDACALLDCPLVAGHTYTYSSKVFVPQYYSGERFNACFFLDDDGDDDNQEYMLAICVYSRVFKRNG